jgi:hypothetical protein
MKPLKIILSILLMLPFMASAQFDDLAVKVTSGIDNETTKANIENNTAALLSAFNKAVVTGAKTPTILKGSCTKSAEKTIKEMWTTSAISCPMSKLTRACLTMPGGGYQLRDIAVTMMDAPIDQQEQELVITYTTEGLIDNITVAIESQRYADIIDEHRTVDDLIRREMVIDFVENFRTAYNRKDLPFLQTVFSDNAVIITGKLVKVKPQKGKTDLNKQFNNEKISYTVQDKQTYMTNLAKVFKNNKYIDVQFDEIEVINHPVYEDIYGVTLRQVWGSSSYNDTGWVFLLIDFTDQYQPCINVRTWQPEKYSDGRLIDRSEIFSLNDINL